MPEGLQNGNVECDGTGEVGTVCVFSCEGEAYELIGEGFITCDLHHGKAVWSKTIPKCDCKYYQISISYFRQTNVIVINLILSYQVILR